MNPLLPLFNSTVNKLFIGMQGPFKYSSISALLNTMTGKNHMDTCQSQKPLRS